MVKIKVIFSIETYYTLFVTYILTKTTYVNDDIILIISNASIKKETIDRLKKLSIWEEILYIDQEEKIKEIDKIRNVDVLHIFSFGCSLITSYLVKYLFYQNTKIIFTEEGVSTWNYENSLLYAKCDLDSHEVLNRINEIWAFEERMIPNKQGITIKRIEIDYLINNSELRKEYLKELNYVFNYKEEELKNSKIFFDTNLSRVGLMNKIDEIEFDKEIVKLDFKVKLHPHDSLYFKRSIFKNIIHNIYLPWEILYLNKLEEIEARNDMVIFAIFPTAALFNTKIINPNSNIKCICLWKIIKPIIILEDSNLDLHLNKFRSLYGSAIICPNSIEELKKFIKKYKYIDENMIQYFNKIQTKGMCLTNSKFILTREKILFMRTLEYFKEKYNDNLNYCIWGTGGVAKKTIELIESFNCNYKLTGVIDNFKHGKFKGINIYDKKHIDDIKFDIIIICTTIGKEEAELFLMEKNFEYGERYIYGYNVY